MIFSGQMIHQYICNECLLEQVEPKLTYEIEIQIK